MKKDRKRKQGAVTDEDKGQLLMKKIILALTGMYIFMATSASAFVLSGAAVAGVAVTLLPIIQPIAETLIGKVANEIQEAVKDNGNQHTCFSRCKNPLLICQSKKLLSACKSQCQTMEQVGGYKLRIRFGKDWSLVKCVGQGVGAGKQTKQGKGDPKSIAVYSQKDLDSLLNLIAMQMAARHIVDTQGRELKDRDLKKANKTREAVVKESQELVAHIDASIAKNVADGLYGDQ